MQAAVKGKDPKPKGFAGASRALAPPGAPPQGVPSLGVLSAPRGARIAKRAAASRGRIPKGNQSSRAAPQSWGKRPPKRNRKIAGASCALDPLRKSFSTPPSMVPKGARHLLARPVPWLPFRTPFQGSFPKGPKNCWHVLCRGSFSRFLFQAPFQRGKNIAGASCALAPFQVSFSKPQENCWRVLSFLSRSWSNLLVSHFRSFPCRSKRNITHGPPPGHHTAPARISQTRL